MAGVSLPTSVKPLLPLADSTSLKAGTMWSKLADCDSKSTSGLDRIGTRKTIELLAFSNILDKVMANQYADCYTFSK